MNRALGFIRGRRVFSSGIISAYHFLQHNPPELQPAERLWALVDEPLVNRHFETIDEIEELLIKRCNVLSNMKKEIKALTNYYWLNCA